jgi:transcriptional regulator with XRE-family HTH domain
MSNRRATDIDPEVRALAGALRELRQHHGFTQQSFADETGLHRNYIGTIELAKASPTWSTIVRFLDGLGVSVEEFGLLVDHHRAALPPDQGTVE